MFTVAPLRGPVEEDEAKTLNLDSHTSERGVSSLPEENAGGKGPGFTDEWEHDAALRQVVEEIADRVLSGDISNRDDLQRAKLQALRDTGLDSIPTNSLVLDYISKRHPDSLERVLGLLRKKPSRTMSGVAVVAVMTSPHDCPHGRCIFCPGGTDREVPTPQSYTGREPAAMRGAQNHFDPYSQVRRRIEQLEVIGHPTDKIDLILMGGTITARDEVYQRDFVKGCLDGMNGAVSRSFQEAEASNESSRHRCIGMTFETRPDHLKEAHVDLILSLGGTRVELGVQSAFDGPLVESRRGHMTRDAHEATMIAKDSGLKVGYHIMPGIPGSTKEMDVETARRVLSEDSFKPDMIKVYPTLVIGGTELFDMWRRGEYEPLSTEEAAVVVAEMKRITPPWVRIQRVQRDIPSQLVEGGVKKSNLRQLAKAVMGRKGWACRCIRCREIGHSLGPGDDLPQDDEVELKRRDYDASEGKEVFLSFEVARTDSLVGYLRLRRPSERAHRGEMAGAGIVRELKVFGPMVPIGKMAEEKWQHRGYGRRLLREAEEIARVEWGSGRLLVTSGIGAREYYRKWGYERIGPYMGKAL